MMKIYNTLTRTKEEFEPINPGKVGIYVCGPTVYDFIHIGNARPMIVFDTLRRYLEHKGYEVNYVTNFTDIDDKIINRSIKEGIPANEVSEKYIADKTDENPCQHQIIPFRGASENKNADPGQKAGISNQGDDLFSRFRSAAVPQFKAPT